MDQITELPELKVLRGLDSGLDLQQEVVQVTVENIQGVEQVPVDNIQSGPSNCGQYTRSGQSNCGQYTKSGPSKYVHQGELMCVLLTSSFLLFCS